MGKASQELQKQLDQMKTRPKATMAPRGAGRSKPDEPEQQPAPEPAPQPEPAGAEDTAQQQPQTQETADMATTTTKASRAKAVKKPRAAKADKAPEAAREPKARKVRPNLNSSQMGLNTPISQRVVWLALQAGLKAGTFKEPGHEAEAGYVIARLEARGAGKKA